LKSLYKPWEIQKHDVAINNNQTSINCQISHAEEHVTLFMLLLTIAELGVRLAYPAAPL